jgi:hypothetical protein
VRFKVWQMMIVVAFAALAFAISTVCLRWLSYPHISLTIFNETSASISDVRVEFLYGERTAERLAPGGAAATEIQSGGNAGIFVSYRDSRGILKKAEPLYYESGNRGYLEVHVTNEGARFVNGIYAGLDGGGNWQVRVSPKAPMSARSPWRPSIELVLGALTAVIVSGICVARKLRKTLTA